MRIFTAVLFLAPLSITTVALQTDVAFAGEVYPVNDGAIHDVVSQRLATIGLKGPDIVITVQDGVVTLTGKVATDRIRQKAGKMTNRIQGVKNVVNQLTVRK